MNLGSWSIPVPQDVKHLLLLRLCLFSLAKYVDRWHINSPVGLPILSRTVFLIRQTYLAQNVFIPPCLSF